MNIGEYLEQAKIALNERGVLYISVWVRTGAPFTKWKEVLEMHDQNGDRIHHLKLDIRAVPERGKANNEIYRFIADEFGIEKEQVSIVSGITDTRKILLLKTS